MALSSLTATTPSLDFSTSMHCRAYSPAFSWCQTFWCVRVVYNFLLFSNPIIALSSFLAEFKTASSTAEVPHVPEKCEGSFAFCTSTYSILGKSRKNGKTIHVSNLLPLTGRRLLAKLVDIYVSFTTGACCKEKVINRHQTSRVHLAEGSSI